MAKLLHTPGQPRLSGRHGDTIYKWYGDTCVTQVIPKRRKRPRKTAKYAAAHDNLRRGVEYAKAVIADPARKAYYAAPGRKLNRSAYILAKADAMKAPEIEFHSFRYYQGRAGGFVDVRVFDLFRVHTLHITFRDSAGDIVETGQATRRRTNFRYIFKRDHPRDQPLTIEAIAESLPGHRVIITDTITAKTPVERTATPAPVSTPSMSADVGAV
jgi:hypothetical protein